MEKLLKKAKRTSLIIDEKDKSGDLHLFKVDRVVLNVKNCEPLNPNEDVKIKIENLKITYNENKSNELFFDDDLEKPIKMAMVDARTKSLKNLIDKANKIENINEKESLMKDYNKRLNELEKYKEKLNFKSFD